MQKKGKVYFFGTETWERKYLLEYYKGAKNVELIKTKITQRNAQKYKDAEVVSSFVFSTISAGVLEKLPKLKFIATRSTGFDHIDLEVCKSRGIKVANVPTYGENTVAEHTFALMLVVSRKIYQAYEKVRDLEFDMHGLRGFDLKDKTIGIIGMGSIGKHVARIANGFEMKVIAYNPNPDPSLAKQYNFKYVKTLDALLSRSDIISLHAPYNEKTHHMINRENIKRIKKGAILINTARGGLVDTHALMWALDKKILAGAGLDVLEEEVVVKEESAYLSREMPKDHNIMTVLKNHVLIARDNVIVTPHIAFNSKEAVERILETTVKNIDQFFKGKPTNVVN